MKNFIIISLLLLFSGMSLSSQDISNLSIVGVFTEGKTVTANFDTTGTTSPVLTYEWTSTPGGIIGSNSPDLLLTSSEIGATIQVSITLEDPAGTVIETELSPSSPVVIANSKPVANAVSISGGLKAGDILTGLYSYYDVDNDPEASSVFQWTLSDNTTFGDGDDVNLGTSQTHTITAGQEGKYFFFGVQAIAQTGTPTGDFVWSGFHGPVITNTAPTTSNETISGGTYVDDVLIGDYDYDDADNDLEGDSNYRWAAGSTTNFGDAGIIPAATNSSYKIKNTDQGKYLFFGVQPVAQSGVTNGTEVWTASHGPINSQPFASNVIIDNTSPGVGDVLTASYDYNDVDTDLEGTSTFRWLRDGTVEIPGANSKTYTVSFDDIGYTLTFEVVPVASGGWPLEGDPANSSATLSVPADGEPTATDVCISGSRIEGSTLTGIYTYNYGKVEGTSEYRWLRDDVEIPGANSITYTLTDNDVESRIQFAVTPKSRPSVVTGLEVISADLAHFNISNTELSVADSPIALVASPAGGVFSGEGVSLNTFDPAAVNTDNSPFVIQYTYTTYTCTQKSYDTVSVNPVDTYFTSFKNVYCYDNGNDTIYVDNLPADATPIGFEFTDNSAVIAQLNPTAIIFDPSLLGPGNNQDSVYFRYNQAASVIEISRGFVIDSVSSNIGFQNLDDEYCEDASARFISMENVFPGGGSADWTGDMLTNKTATSAIFNPGLVAAGSSYPLTYQYTSPNGCRSSVISENVMINTLPDPSFAIDPTYNVEGDPFLLVPVLAGGTFTGPGIVGNEFYPDLAGVGSHEIRYSVTDANTCSSTTTNNTLVREAQGTIEDLPSVICYHDTTIAISISGLPAGITMLGFSNTSGGITESGPTTADYYIPDVGSGNDTVSFNYIWDGVNYELSREVFVDSIGRVEIIGLKDTYCEYEGDVNIRVSIENSTGTGNFSFTGPDSAFVNYGEIADLYPYKTPTSASAYQISYTHVSSVQSSACRKTSVKDVYVFAEPDVEIITDRITANLNEIPFELQGNPVDATFSGNGVYKDGAVYKFNPQLAGTGESTITLSYIDGNSCFASVSKNILVVQAEGTIEGVNANNQYCYDGLTDVLWYENSVPGWTGIGFQGKGINNTDNVTAEFNPALAGQGDHQIIYSYYDSVMTRFDIPVTLKVDSLGSVEINNLDPGAEFCSNEDPIELFTSKLGGVFTGPVDDGFLDPSLGIGDTQVSYTYTNTESQCYTSVTVPIKIHPAPEVEFDVTDVCIENDKDTTFFVNNTSSGDAVDLWEWRFGDPGSFNESTLESPGHMYKTYGPRSVKLTATTINGCQSSLEKNIDLGIKPEAEFTWSNDCFIVNDSLVLSDASVSPTPIIDYSWDLYNGQALLSGEQVKYPKTDVGEIDVQLIVKTSYAACHDTITRKVTIRPTIIVTEDDYYEDFESGAGGWVTGLEDDLNLWSLGTPDRATINRASSGENAWFTSYEINGQEESGYSVESPCFDFTNIERPYVSVDIWKSFDKNRDGVALQYRIGNTGKWKLIGSLDDGINWYNSVLINGSPGGSSIGWTSVGDQDTSWLNVRNKLDLIEGKRDIKFRIVYGTDGTANNNEGFAFDNFRISTRSRNVLAEHFTNYNNIDNKDANELLKEVVDNTGKDVINVQYHTNIPDNDHFYFDNEADVGARMLYYGLSGTPYSFVDGGINSLYAYEYDYVLNNKIDSVDIYKRSMISPGFNIDLSSQISGEVLTASCDITALKDISASNLTLYLLVVEKEITTDMAPNGESVFYNVFKKMLPDAGGTDLKKIWTKGDSETFESFSWIIENIYETGDIEIIAFIQDNISKKVYQAASTIEPDVTTDISEFEQNSKLDRFAVYPNPASDFISLNFRKEIERESALIIYNYLGNKVFNRDLSPGITEFRIDDLKLPDGIYFINLTRNGISIDRKKLIISER